MSLGSLRLAALPLLASSLAGCGHPASFPGDGDPHGFFRPRRLGLGAGDDWEPAVAADPEGRVYVLYKHHDASGPLCEGCDRHLVLQRSTDGGQSFTAPLAIAPGDSPQYDPQIAVDPEDAQVVWASFLQDDLSRIAVVRSTDHGLTWSPPRIVSSQPPGLDKDTLAVRGQTVAVAYDDDFNTFAAVSTDGGQSWSSGLVLAGDDAFSLSLSSGGAVDAGGRLFFAWNSFDAAHRETGDGPVKLWVSRSLDAGATWARTVIDTSGAPPAGAGCGYSYLSAQLALRAGGDGAVYLLWNAAPMTASGGPERIFWSRSLDGGLAYTPAIDVSDAPGGVEHCFPALAVGRRAGDVRLGWMDRRYGGWNVFYRSSADGGAQFGPVQRVSPDGFGSPYGDYFQMSVGEDGRAHVAWGESARCAGPGNVRVSRGPEP